VRACRPYGHIQCPVGVGRVTAAEPGHVRLLSVGGLTNNGPGMLRAAPSVDRLRRRLVNSGGSADIPPVGRQQSDSEPAADRSGVLRAAVVVPPGRAPLTGCLGSRGEHLHQAQEEAQQKRGRGTEEGRRD
jgi:hypothetical protein